MFDIRMNVSLSKKRFAMYKNFGINVKSDSMFYSRKAIFEV